MGVILALFANFECKCEKAIHIQAFCRSINLFILPISIILHLIPLEIPEKVNNNSPLFCRYRCLTKYE
jgi:hypothetical protein